MNTKTLYGLGILAAIVSSCSTVEQDFKDDALITKEQKEVIITASVESRSETRTVLNSQNLSVLWKPADEIKVFSAGEASKFISQNSENQKAVNFLGTISVITGTAEGTDIDTHIYGLYPYTDDATMTDGAFTTTLPSVQTGIAETFDDDLFISIGRSYTFSMGFWNVCSGYRFSFTEDGYQSVTLTSNDGTPLAGTFVVTFNDDGKPIITSNPDPSASVTVNAPEGGFVANTWYYLIVLPGTHAAGYTFTATNASGTGTYVIDEEKTLNRSKFKQVEGLDEYLEFPSENNVIYYTSYNGVITPYATDVFGASIESNVYEDGVGVITFDGDVTSIGDSAFKDCWALTSITLPNSVITIERDAFNGCRNLSSMSIPESVTKIGSYAFYSCDNLVSISIPNSVTVIGNNAFTYCSKLESIVIPDSVTTIWDGTFGACSALQSVTIPESVTSIKRSAFNQCTSLTSIFIPRTLTNIEDGVFYYCGLTSIIVDPDNPVLDSRDNCNAIIETGSNTLRFGCQNTIIPETVTSIAGWAFTDYTGITSISIPASVTSIGKSAFNGCSGLESIYVYATTPPAGSDFMFKNTNNCPIYVPANSVDSYKEAQYWSDYADRIEAIPVPVLPGEYVVYYTSTDGQIVTPASDGYGAKVIENEYVDGQGILSFDGPITGIPNSAFARCSTLASVIIPNTVTSIGASAFSYCSNLASVTLPESIVSIGAYGFAWCYSLSSISIPSSITEIAMDTFTFCTSLTDIIIPDSVTSIGMSAFSDCDNLRTITIPNSVTSIGDYAFRNDYSLSMITIPASVTSIGDVAFKECSGLKSVTVLSSVPPSAGLDVLYGTNNCPIFVPTESVEDYKTAQVWYLYAARIQGLGIDLGLSVKWAQRNLGALSDVDAGGYYAWGETVTKESYTIDNYIYSNTSFPSVLPSDHDAAQVVLGGQWRIPTKNEWEELVNENNCSWEWTTIDNINGYKVTSIIPGYTGNWIFLPACGFYRGSTLNRYGTRCDYWSSNSRGADSPWFFSDYDGLGMDYDEVSHLGYSIRPVYEQ